MRYPTLTAISLTLALSLGSNKLQAIEVGFAKVDITPDVPLRLSGYGSRSTVSEGVDERLSARVMAIRTAGSQLSILVSVDTIGFPGSLTKSIAKRVEEQHSVARSHFVLCGTHSHTAPQISDGLPNIFAVPLTSEQERATREYTSHISDLIVDAVAKSITDLQPAKLFSAVGTARFAHNRRVLADGKWTGFGITADGPTDFSVPVLKIVDAAGKTRGVVFNYACHCTTFGPGYNRVNGDWAGHAARMLEAQFAGATALCTIGCGADQNPERSNDPDRALILARSHGQQIADEVSRLCGGEMTAVDAALRTSFGYAGLPVERPSAAELRATLNDRSPQVRRHAQNMLDLQQRMGRLPETYPAPVQVWRFGNQVCMIFLGGEVVVDYALRLQREIDSGLVWVSAYANDVFGYVASERIRQEGGYEVSGSMVYYNQPGPWQEGTEEVLVRRIHELVEQGSFAGPFSPEESLEHFHLSPGYKIGIVAAEPLISDPVNFAVDADGRLWVVEMGDYPRGENDSGEPGGKVRLLEDQDGDGRYDKSTVFLEGLAYPNGVFPWGKGVLISGAPAIIYAEDTDGDGVADTKQPLYEGFEEDNPQHRAAGFSYGLDNWLYLASGTNNHDIESLVTGDSVDMSGRDLRIRPRQGLIETVSGRTQFGRNRDDWGNWFGGDNSHPAWHFVLDDRYLKRNPYFPAPAPIQHLLVPPLAPPVFPTSRTLDRFNDLFALNRFTSACSPMVFRDSTLGPDVDGALFISEPVHNLVHRAILTRSGATFQATRHATEIQSEFLSSTDHWFRPTTTTTGPDGALWVADMYRHVIEHPEWIPESWQAQLDLRAGHDRGRIYRIYQASAKREPIPKLAQLTSEQLVAELESSNGWRRDTAQRLLVERGATSIAEGLVELLRSAKLPTAKVHALGTLSGLDVLAADHVMIALSDADPRVVRQGIAMSEPLLDAHESLAQKLMELSKHPDASVRLQVALSLGEWDAEEAGTALANMGLQDVGDTWIRTAVLSSSHNHAATMLGLFVGEVGGSPDHSQLLQHLIATAIRADRDGGLAAVLATLTGSTKEPALWEMEALASLDRAIRLQGKSFASLQTGADGRLADSLKRVARVMERARVIALDEDAAIAHRLIALPLLGRGAKLQTEDSQTLLDMLSASNPDELQVAAVRSLSELESSGTPQQLLSSWRQLSPRIQSEVLNALLSKGSWREQLVTALEEGKVTTGDLDATSRGRLVSAGSRELRERARKVLGGAQNPDRQAVIDQYRSAMSDPSDLTAGAVAFKKVCASCHRHNGIGNDIGASLTALQDKSNAAMLVAVLDPNRAMEGKYKNYTCVTVDGRVLSGMIVAESSSSITLAQANGTQATLLRVDIDELASTGVSFMPEGLERDFSPSELNNIFAFIRSNQE